MAGGFYEPQPPTCGWLELCMLEKRQHAVFKDRPANCQNPQKFNKTFLNWTLQALVCWNIVVSTEPLPSCIHKMVESYNSCTCMVAPREVGYVQILNSASGISWSKEGTNFRRSQAIWEMGMAQPLHSSPIEFSAPYFVHLMTGYISGYSRYIII